jgi:glutathione S-transferase
MITVHHLNNSRSHRVLWLLEELGLDYEVMHYKREASLRAPAALRAIHPLGKSPTVVVTDGSGKTETLAESAAILEYLVERHGGGRFAPPAGTSEHLRYRYWMHYAEGSMMLPLVLMLIFKQMPRQSMPMLVRPVVRSLATTVIDTFVQPQIDQHLSFIEGELEKTRWFAGDEFTAADIQMSFPIEASAARGGLSSGRPKTWGYLQAIRERPAYKRAIAKGGPLELGHL